MSCVLRGWGLAADPELRRHYEDCYDTLVDMFSSTSLLTPRTKRWAEAKVLADCLTVKVCPSHPSVLRSLIFFRSAKCTST